MSFGQSWVLWGLAALALPIALHLFRFRPRKTFVFSDLRFVEETRSQSSARQKLLERLLLAARLLLFAALIFAFAEPRFSEDAVAGDASSKIWIAFDNSPSMNSGASGISLFEKAREAVRSKLENADVESVVVLWTPDRGRSSEMGRDEAIARIDALEPGSERCTASDLFAQFRTAEAGFDLWLVSDFQADRDYKIDANADTAALNQSASRRVDALLLQNEEWRNLPYLDSIWFSKPFMRTGLRQELVCSIRNPSEAEQKALVHVSLAGSALGVYNTRMKPLGDTVLRFGFTVPDSSVSSGEVRIRFEQNQATAFGPGFEQNFAVNPGKPLVVAVVGSGQGWQNLLKAPDFELKILSPKGSLSALDCDFVVLDHVESITEGELKSLSDFEESGGSILLYPPKDLTVFAKLNNWLRQRHSVEWAEPIDTQKSRWGGLNLDHPLWFGSIEELPDRPDLPLNRLSYSLRGSGFSTAASSARGAAMVIRSGRLTLLGTRPEGDWSSVGAHPLWVPLVLNTAFSGAEAIPPSISAAENRIELSGIEDGLQVAWIHNGQRSVPEQKRNRGGLSVSLETASADGAPYSLIDETGNRIGSFYLNPEPIEQSRDVLSAADFPEAWTVNTLAAQGADAQNQRSAIVSYPSKIEPWKMLILAALLFALIEAALFRFDPFKTQKAGAKPFESTRNIR